MAFTGFTPIPGARRADEIRHRVALSEVIGAAGKNRKRLARGRTQSTDGSAGQMKYCGHLGQSRSSLGTGGNCPAAMPAMASSYFLSLSAIIFGLISTGTVSSAIRKWALTSIRAPGCAAVAPAC